MTPRRQIIMRYAVVMLLGIAGTWLHYGIIANRTHQLRQLLVEHARLEAQLDLTLDAELGMLRHRTAANDAALPLYKDVATALAAITTDLNALHVDQRVLTTGTHVDAGPIRRIPLSLSFTGSLTALLELLVRMDHDDRIFRVERLVVHRDAEAAPDALTVSIRFSTFSRQTRLP